MATAAELASFASKTTFAVPTIDYQVGVSSSVLLKSYKSLPTGSSSAPIVYDPTTKVLHVRANGAVLDGYDLTGVMVSVEANNVTIKNSKFDASFGPYSIIQATGKSGLTVDHNSFDGLKLDSTFSDFINGGNGKVTITYNSFLNVPSDSIQLKSGVVDHNYFSGTGYHTGAHADAINIDGAVGPVSITNNFIDNRHTDDAKVYATSAIAISNASGNNQSINVSNNVLLGGAYTVYATTDGVHTYSTLDISNNFVAAGQFGDLYPNNKPAALNYTNNTATNVTSTLLAPVVAKAGLVVSGTAGQVGQVLKGTDSTDWLYGHGNNDVLVGGLGRDFLNGGKGTDIFEFDKASDSNLISGQDLIGGFEDQFDRLNLHGLAVQSGHALSFIGGAAFNGQIGVVHELHIGNSTFIEADLTGKKTADFRVEISGNHTLAASNFTF